LRKVPENLLRTSFPYRRRPYAEEILFTDTISIVRFIGGWAESWSGGEEPEDRQKADLAYIDDGAVRYRWHLLAPRLAPYLNMGYQDIVISLDNVPYALAAYESHGTYGQVAPPRDYGEWHRFIKELCRHLVKLYGFDLPNRWSFRMGTENSNAVRGAKHTFDGNHDQWIRWYDSTSDAVKRVLPGAEFGPGEFQGRIIPGGPEPAAVNYVKLVEHCISGTNESTGANGAPIDFIANSSHSVPRWVDGEIFGCGLPGERTDWNVSSYENLKSGHAGMKGIPVYVFQFGVLQSELTHNGRNLPTSEPGGRGAAWTFQVLMRMRSRVPALRGIWHWDTMDTIANYRKSGAGTANTELLMANGWVYTILDFYQGGDAYVAQLERSQDGSDYTALYVTMRNEGLLMCALSTLERSDLQPRRVSCSIPRHALPKDFAPTHLLQTELTEANCVHAAVKRDLENAHCLNPAYAGKPQLAQLKYLVDPDQRERGNAVIAANAEMYERILADTFELKPFCGTATSNGESVTLCFDVTPASVKVITVNHRAANDERR
jgi:hypothetical protein